MSDADAAQARMDALTSALNAAIRDIESSGMLRATIWTSSPIGSGSQSVRVEVREWSKFELELRECRG